MLEEDEQKAVKEAQELAEAAGRAPTALKKNSSVMGTPMRKRTTAGGAARDGFLFKNAEENASPRLRDFSAFCWRFKTTLNSLVRQMYGNAENRQPGQAEALAKDLETVCEYIKYMPAILDFDNKRIYLRKELKRLKRHAQTNIKLQLRRDQIFPDTFQQMQHLHPDELRGDMEIAYSGERGMDWGGLLRDFFIEISKAMFNREYALFVPSDGGATYLPDARSGVQGIDHVKWFKFCGRIIGKAVMENCLVEAYFVRSIYKMIIGQNIQFKDLQDFDNELYEGLNWCLKKGSDVTALYETFCISQDEFGVEKTIDLKPGGRDIDVDNDNKLEYVELKAFFHMYTNVKDQLDAFIDGFHDVIPQELIGIFTYQELELLISGMPDFKMADLRANTLYSGYTEDSQQIIWFWEFMDTLNREERMKFLQFATGSSKVPVEGFALLPGHK